MRRACLAAALAVSLAAPPAALADPITFVADALHKRPGLVLVDTQSVTTLQFCRGVSWSTYKASWLKVTASPQDRRVLLLDASGTSGETTLMVWLEGDGLPLQLAVRVVPQAQTHVYFVSCDQAQGTAARAPSAPPAQRRAETPAAAGGGGAAPSGGAAGAGSVAGDWDRLVSSLSDDQWQKLSALIRDPTPERQSAFEATLSRYQWALWARVAPTLRMQAPQGGGNPPAVAPPQPVAPAGGGGLPSWLAWSSRVTASGGGILVSYTLQNSGQVDVVADPARLRVEDEGGAPLPGVSVSREDTSGIAGRITPGGAESGAIRVAAPPRGTVTIVWPVVAIDGSGTTYTVRDTVDVP